MDFFDGIFGLNADYLNPAAFCGLFLPGELIVKLHTYGYYWDK